LFPRLIRQVNTKPSYLIQTSSFDFISKNNITKNLRDFCFLNKTYNLYEVGWDNKDISKLWRYNLHYFDFLLQDNMLEKHQEVNKIIEKWIEENKFGKGTAWEPYPTSIRIINCIKWHFEKKSLSENIILSLWNQTRWLANRPEYHILGNHLFVNSKALLFSCALFKQEQNSVIYNKALNILEKELDEQFLNDGAHFELSPMYHSLAMEDLLDLLSISGLLPSNFPAEKIKEKLVKGMEWLETMIYNNEELSHFNDSANGIANKYSDLKTYCDRLGVYIFIDKNKKLFHHKESGYIVFKENNVHLIADVGKVGPDYLPGHAHADTLSFEMSLKKQRIIVNSGTSVYGVSLERNRQRSTSSHSTVEVEKQNSSEVWSGFRVARRAKPFNVEFNYTDIITLPISFSASHDGYKRLKNSSIHKRSWSLNIEYCDIEDEISGKNNFVISRYFFHPDIEIKKQNKIFIISKENSNFAEISFFNAVEVEIINSTYHDEFGLTKLNKCIQLKAISPCNFKIKIKYL
jgi:uncharacterized heparinase superfamily protein